MSFPYPDQPVPDGPWRLGDGKQYGQSIDKDSVAGIVTNGAKNSFVTAQDTYHATYNTPISEAKTIADTAVTQSQAAVNAANQATEVADLAYENASYWETECVVASAGVILGVNELFIGLCQNVPTGKVRLITDMHVALLSNPNGLTIETRKWNATGTSSSVIRTDVLVANQTRVSYQIIPGHAVLDKERIFWNITSITGTTDPQVLQILVFGVITDAS